jgi:hypothetical protein
MLKGNTVKKLKSAAIAAAVVATVGGAALAVAAPAFAYGSPSNNGSNLDWVSPGANADPNAVGGIEFFDPSGNVIHSGASNTKPVAAYSVGLSTLDFGDQKATMYAYVPINGVNAGTWTNSGQLTSSTTYPNATAPSPVHDTTLPVAAGAANDPTSLASVATSHPLSTSGENKGLIEIRIYTGGGGNGTSTTYDYAVLSIDSTNKTWTEIYSPDQAGVSTVTAVSHTPTTGITDQSTVALTAQVTAADATNPAGSVQFYDGGTAIGSPVNVQADGTATYNYVDPSASSHSITATFTPTALSGYSTSTSTPADTFTATHITTNTTTSLIANNNNPTQGDTVNFTATVTPASATGTVTFTDTSTTPVTTLHTSTLSAGSATYAANTSTWATGAHNIVATYNGDANNNTSSSSPPTVVTVGAPTIAPDNQSITADIGAGSIAITTPYGPNNALNLGTLALDPSGKFLSASAQIGDGTIANTGTGAAGAGVNPQTGTGDIQVVDTRAGNPGWTVSALTSGLATTATPVAGQFTSINGENVGLTAVTPDYVVGNSITAATPPSITNNPAANPPVSPTDTGSQGLGGTTKHPVATAAAGQGTGTVGFHGTLTVTAPTSTEAGHYTGTITFTVA